MQYSGSVNDTTADQTSLHKRSFPLCPKCNQTCSVKDTSVIKVFNQVYHNSCFVCEDCQKPVVDKYFIVDDHAQLQQQKQQKYQKRKKIVLCEYHHLSRLGLICLKCNQPITATAEYNYHPECVQCPFCATATSNQYEFKGKSYCRLHFSLIPETHCAGCKQAILDQYVEHHSLPDKIWHPECYMIFKFWGVKLAPSTALDKSDINNLLDIQEQVQTTVSRVWEELSSFEESSASCISDMLLNVAAGSFIEGMRMANQFVLHLEILLNSLNVLNRHLLLQNQELQCNEESRQICEQLIRFFHLLSTPAEADSSITQQLLILVTNLAQNLKLLIRSGLSTALRLERECGIKNAMIEYLDQLSELEKRRVWIAGRYWFKDTTVQPLILDELPPFKCSSCQQIIDNTDYYVCQQRKWHIDCLTCHTCSQSLDEKSALVTANAPSCKSCCTDNNNKDIMHCKLVTPIEHSLRELKLYLTKMSFSTASSDITIKSSQSISNSRNEEHVEKIELDKDYPIKVKRQYSLLRKLRNRVQDQQLKRGDAPERGSSVRIGRIARKGIQTSVATPMKEAVTEKKTRNSMVIDTIVPYHKGESSSISPTILEQHTPTVIASPISPLTPLSVTSQKENANNNVRRTFSTDSQRKRRSSLINMFDRRKRRESRRTSVCTIDVADTALLKNMYFPCLTPAQDLIVRHASIFALQPLITPPVSLDELASFISPKPTKRNSMIEAQKKTANTAIFQKWERFLTRNNKFASSKLPLGSGRDSKAPHANKTFGMPLSIIALRDYQHESTKRKTALESEKRGVTLHDVSPAFNASLSSEAFIPSFVKSCVSLLLKSDISTEGIFRKNGNIRQLRSLCTSIDALETNTDQATVEKLLANEQAIQLAALLKKYLRDLPEPLLTFSLYELFVRCGRIESDKRKRALHLVCCLLPKPNRDTMLLIFCCLKWVSNFSDINKMSISNLARVFAPTILFDKAEKLSNVSEEIRQGAEDEINVIETLIEQVDEISMIPSELTEVALDNMSQLNSKEFISQYQQLLTSTGDSKKPSKNNTLNDFIRKTKAFDSCIKTADHSISEKIDLTSLKKTAEKGAPEAKQRRISWLYGLKRR